MAFCQFTDVIWYKYQINSICRGVVRNFNPWVPKVSHLQIWPIILVFTDMKTFFSSKSVGSILHFTEVCGFPGTHGTHANYAPGPYKLTSTADSAQSEANQMWWLVINRMQPPLQC